MTPASTPHPGASGVAETPRGALTKTTATGGPPRVVMLGYLDTLADTRVQREAEALADAGWEVVVIGRSRLMTTVRASSRLHHGTEHRAIPVPRRWRASVVTWWYPWRRRAWLLDRLKACRSPRPASLISAAGAALLVLLLAPWVAERALFYAVLERRRVGSGSDSSVRWLAGWRFGVIGWANRAARAAPPADVYHGHDLAGLAAAVAASRRTGGRVLYDVRDLAADSASTALRPAWVRLPIKVLERRLAHEVDALVTVNPSLATHLAATIGLGPATIVGNHPPRRACPGERPGPLRRSLGLPGAAPLVLYHGSLSWTRGLREMLVAQLRPELEGVHVVLMGSGALWAEVESAAADPRRNGLLHVCPPVPADELAEWVTDADVGLALNLPNTLNDRLSTPNKLFECLAAGVPVVSSDFPERRRILCGQREGPLGGLCDPTDPADIARAIREILDLSPAARHELRQRCADVANERWSWEADAARLVALYGHLLAIGSRVVGSR